MANCVVDAGYMTRHHKDIVNLQLALATKIAATGTGIQKTRLKAISQFFKLGLQKNGVPSYFVQYLDSIENTSIQEISKSCKWQDNLKKFVGTN